MTIANNRVMTDATGQEILSALQNLAAVQAVPYVASIPTGQWSGSGNDYYITINASNVTANSILIPNYDNNSLNLLKGPVWCVPAAGSFTIHTSAIPAGTVTIMVMFAGTMGEAQYQVLADVYSKSQTDTAIAQSTANYVDVNLGDVTLNSRGYLNISSFLPTGKTIINTSILAHENITPVGSFGVYASGLYLFGPASAAITDLRLRYYFKI